MASPRRGSNTTAELLLQCPQTSVLRLRHPHDNFPTPIASGTLDLFLANYGSADRSTSGFDSLAFISVSDALVLPLFKDVRTWRGTLPRSVFMHVKEGEREELYRLEVDGCDADSFELFLDILGTYTTMESDATATATTPTGDVKTPFPPDYSTIPRPNERSMGSGVATSSTSNRVDWDDAAPLSDMGDPSQFRNQVVFLNDDGKVIGKVDDNMQVVVEDAGQRHMVRQGLNGSRDQVVVELEPTDAKAAMRRDSYSLGRNSSRTDMWVDKIDMGAAQLGELITQGAIKLSGRIETAGEGYKRKLVPLAEPTRIDDSTRQNFRAMENATLKATKVSGRVVQAVGRFGAVLGTRIAEYNQKNEEQRNAQNREPSNWDNAKRLAGHTLVAACNISENFHEGVKVVLKSGSATAVDLVEYKNGPEAGTIARSSAQSLRNATVVFVDVTGLRRKAILKTAVVESAKQMNLQKQAKEREAERLQDGGGMGDGVLIPNVPAPAYGK